MDLNAQLTGLTPGPATVVFYMRHHLLLVCDVSINNIKCGTLHNNSEVAWTGNRWLYCTLLLQL
jgi:hypothetical protein